MRLFIAIDLPEEIRKLVNPILNQVPVGKPAPIDQLHLTLKFIGEFPEQNLPVLKKTLQELKTSNFFLKLKGVGCFPSEKRPRVLWMGFEESAALQGLQKSIDQALKELKIPPDDRPFHPHLTLARIKNPHTALLGAFLKNNYSFESPEFTATAFHLYSSILTPKGAIHRIEHTLPLLEGEQR